MTIEVCPLASKCNLSCPYCYENVVRDTNDIDTVSYDMEKMKAALLKVGASFTIFGGEPLLVPINDLEELFKFGLEKFDNSCQNNSSVNTIQTNGVLITDEHIDLFKKYRVCIGVSMDGPDDLNDSRWSGTLEKTRETTKKSFENTKKLLAAGIPTSMIMTYYKKNAHPDVRPRMKQWFKDLEAAGLKQSRIHIMEWSCETIKNNMGIAIDEMATLLLDMANFQKNELKTLSFDLFTDIPPMLMGQDNNSTCVWHGCDPMHTTSCHSISGQGVSSNCGHVNKDGIEWLRTEDHRLERNLALYHTPQEYGGCKDCRFYLMCKGHCIGPSIDYDWRNKTRLCEVWKSVFEYHEAQLVREGKEPLSLSVYRKSVENAYIHHVGEGRHPFVSLIYDAIKNNKDALSIDMVQNFQHGDHNDLGHPNNHNDVHNNIAYANSDGGHIDNHINTHADGHGDVAHADGHGDVAHGDGYGLHTDAYSNDHGDVPHRDGYEAHSDGHDDIPHGDEQLGGKKHTDASHSNLIEAMPYHGDRLAGIYSNAGIQKNNHTNIAHEDVPHQDSNIIMVEVQQECKNG